MRGFMKGMLLGGFLGAMAAWVMSPDSMHRSRKNNTTMQRMGERMQRLGAKIQE